MSEVIRRRLPAFGVCLLALLAGAMQLYPLQDSDTWWHLWGGSQVWAQGARVFPDVSTFTQDAWPWADTEWLFQLLLYGSWELAGPAGVELFTALLAASAVALVGALGLRLAGARRWLGLSVVVIVVCCISYHFTPRPQMAFMVLLPAALLLLERPPSGAGFAALLLLQLVWSQTHSSHVLLPIIVAIRALGVLGTPWSPSMLRASLPRLGLAVALGLVALLAGPRGVAIVHEVLGHAATDAARHLGDMRPADWVDLMPHGLGMNTWLWVAALLGLHALARRRVRVDDLLLALLGLLLIGTAIRFRAAAALLLLPLLARPPSGERASWPRLEAWSALTLLVVALPASWAGMLRAAPSMAPGLGVHGSLPPVGISDLLEEWGAEGHLYNHYDDGGYLIWRHAPALQVAIDGRTPTFHSAEHHAMWRQSARSTRTFLGMDARWGIDHALVHREQPLCAGLVEHPGWRAVHADERRVLFTRVEGPLRPGEALELLPLCSWQAEPWRCPEETVQAQLREELGRVEARQPGMEWTAALGRRLAACPAPR